MSGCGILGAMWIVKNEHCREGAEIVELFKGNSVFQ
jgi:hypothetical protein